MIELNFNEEQAEEIGVTAGFGIARKLQAAMQVDSDRLIELLAHPNTAAQAAPAAGPAMEAARSEPERKALTEGKAKRLIVVPDGPLALLPFDTLVVVPGESPTYLLDVGTADSVRGLGDAVDQPEAETGGRRNKQPRARPHGRRPHVRVGRRRLANRGPLASLSARSRYRRTARSLIAAALFGSRSPMGRQGVCRSWDQRRAAAAGRGDRGASPRRSPGRRIVHLACHGLTDQSHGNLFGSLVLTPAQVRQSGQRRLSDPGGDLRACRWTACELAVLSACNTNFGPRQQGEGVWALSRGFLVAGARRVVASNWVVDDRAGASLISYFCGGSHNNKEKENIGRLRRRPARRQTLGAQQTGMEQPVLLGDVCTGRPGLRMPNRSRTCFYAQRSPRRCSSTQQASPIRPQNCLA